MTLGGINRVSRHRKRTRKRIAGASLMVLGILFWVSAVVADLGFHERRDELLYLSIPLGGAAVVGGIIFFATAL
jgi:small neutral amino acid transporter SnatA (MarC family)